MGGEGAGRTVTTDDLFLPRGYSENMPEPVDSDDGLDFWARADEMQNRSARRYQDPVYKLVDRRAPADATVLDVGCGIGENLVRRVAGNGRRVVGVDQTSAIAVARAEFPEQEWIAGDLRSEELWASLGALQPDVVVCADVIEHVDDPVLLLERLGGLLRAGTSLVLSTPDRDRLEDQLALGPPRNPHHIREWAEPELRQLVESVGLVVQRTQHVLPRRYPVTWLETKMVVWRALHGRAVPARRSCMVFELAPG
jgi:SAM-dependent methyltransferase